MACHRRWGEPSVAGTAAFLNNPRGTPGFSMGKLLRKME